MIETILNRDYFKGVLSRMSENSTVRFGITGEGVAPNYEVFYASVGKPLQYRGQNHEGYGLTTKSQFKERNLSRPYTYEEVRHFINVGRTLLFKEGE